LHEVLARKLDELGRSGWLREDCRALIERVCHAQPDPQPQRSAAQPTGRSSARRCCGDCCCGAKQRHAPSTPKPWLLDDAHALNLRRNRHAAATNCSSARARCGVARAATSETRGALRARH
jgi:hypothetical protein